MQYFACVCLIREHGRILFMKILGIGFSCVDMIQKDDRVKFMNGGTCLNVLTVLSQLGWKSEILLPLLKQDALSTVFEENMRKLGVVFLGCGKSRRPVSRIIQIYDKQKKHEFILKCPKCGKKMITRPFGTEAEYEQIAHNLKNYDLLYFDRITYGIKRVVKDFAKVDKPVIYEPNSGRNLKAVAEISGQIDVLKFSITKISLNAAEKIAITNKDSRLKLMIATAGSEGLYFRYRENNGNFSSWIKIDGIENQNIVDTSGAGDWLTAGFLYSFFENKEYIYNKDSLTKAFLFGMKLSGICMQAEGAQGSFYSKELLQLLKEQFHFRLEQPMKIKRPIIDNEKACTVCHL